MKYLPLTARICLALIFLKAGITHLMGFGGFADMLGQRLFLGGLLAAATILLQLAGGLSLLLGYKIKMGALLLIIFLVPATLMFHNFLADGEQLNAFLKNVGLIGGLLMMIYTGAGAASLDQSLGR